MSCTQTDSKPCFGLTCYVEASNLKLNKLTLDAYRKSIKLHTWVLLQPEIQQDSDTVFVFPETKRKTRSADHFYGSRFPISVNPRHMTRAGLQGRKKTLLGFTMLALKNPNRIIWTRPGHARTKTHIVKEIIINLVELEAREQPITAKALSHSKQFYLYWAS